MDQLASGYSSKRVDIWLACLEHILNEPFFGYGNSTFKTAGLTPEIAVHAGAQLHN